MQNVDAHKKPEKREQWRDTERIPWWKTVSAESPSLQEEIETNCRRLNKLPSGKKLKEYLNTLFRETFINVCIFKTRRN